MMESALVFVESIFARCTDILLFRLRLWNAGKGWTARLKRRFFDCGSCDELREASLRWDDGLWMRRREQMTTKTKYRDLSIAAARWAAFGRDDVWFVDVLRMVDEQVSYCSGCGSMVDGMM
jgi:hypothetical protein